MSLFDSIMNFLKSLFAGKETVQTTEQETKTEEVSTDTLSRQRMLTDPVCAIPVNDSSFVTGTRMKVATFDFMVCTETAETKEQVKAEMRTKDAIGNYPYDITTSQATYSIHRATNGYGWDLTEEIGTGYDMSTHGL